MRALTIHQPWASLIAAGVKQIETRPTRTRHRGPLAIHASLLGYWQVRDQFLDDEEYLELERILRDHKLPPMACLPRGAVLGTADVVNCGRLMEYRLMMGQEVRFDDGRRGIAPHYGDLERKLGDYTPGRWLWVLRDPRMLAEPIPWRGMQGLWECPIEALLGETSSAEEAAGRHIMVHGR